MFIPFSEYQATVATAALRVKISTAISVRRRQLRFNRAKAKSGLEIASVLRYTPVVFVSHKRF
jgi:hypothetical protein